jgi:hypothetical protein
MMTTIMQALASSCCIFCIVLYIWPESALSNSIRDALDFRNTTDPGMPPAGDALATDDPTSLPRRHAAITRRSTNIAVVIPSAECAAALEAVAKQINFGKKVRANFNHDRSILHLDGPDDDEISAVIASFDIYGIVEAHPAGAAADPSPTSPTAKHTPAKTPRSSMPPRSPSRPPAGASPPPGRGRRAATHHAAAEQAAAEQAGCRR